MRPITQLRRALFLIAVPLVLILTGNVHADCSAPPIVSISAELDDDGVVHGVVEYNYPDTTSSGQRGLEVTVDVPGGSGHIAGFHPADVSGTWEFTDPLSCRQPGLYLYKARAVSCGSRITDASHPVDLDTTPTVEVSYAGPDEFGHGTVTVDYNFPNTSSSSQRTLQHEVFDPNGFSGLGPQLHPTEQQGTWVFSFPMTCRATGTYTHKITLFHCNGTQKTDTDDVEVDSLPTVSVSPSAPDDNGVIDIAVTFDFPMTDAAGQRRVDVLTENAGGTGLISSFQPAEKTGTRHFPYNVACAPPQNLTFLGAVYSCGRGPVEDRAPVTFSHTPTVSVSIAHNPLEAVVDYSFLGTGSSAQRTLRVEWVGGGLIGEIHPNTATGQKRFPLNVCGAGTVRATATACNNAQDIDEETVDAPKKPTATVTLRKGALDASGKRWIEGRLDYNMGDANTGWVTRADLLPWTNADGVTYGFRNVLPPLAPTQRVGFRTFTFLPDSGAQQMTVLGVAETCAGRGTDETFIECGCEAATKDPVHFIDGNVRVTDGEPLPSIAGHGLTRTYNSDEQVVALFGRGWTTLFDRRLVLNNDGAEQIVSIVTESNEVVTFRGTGGVYHQTWPTAQPAVGVLLYDAGSGTFSHRPANSNEVSIFNAATGRIHALRDFRSGHEAQFAYDANGLPQSLTDSWSGVSWIVTMEPGQRRISTISVNGFVWTYVYDGSGNLITVTAPGSAPWRTYEYAADRMTASRDALGNLIESHTYDANGYGISSTGPSDEIASIVYLPGATADERLTRITDTNNSVSEHTMRVVGGAWRLVRSDGGCASCGSGDATYARDDRGRVVREQGADGYITATTYANDVVVSVQESLKPFGCDPQTDPQRCRLDPDALAAATLESTSSSVTTTYEYADPLWPDRPTKILRPSVVSPAYVRDERRLYNAATGALTRNEHRARQGDVLYIRATVWTFYEGAATAPVFDPGGVFQSSWLSLPQPINLIKTVDGPRTDVQDMTSYVYYPIDSSVPALLRSHLAAMKNAAGHITRYEDYDVFGNATRVVDPNGVATEMTYDALGRPLTTTTKAAPGCNTALDPLCSVDVTTTRVYTPASGPLARVTNPEGGVTEYTYDDRGRLHTLSRGYENDLSERIETTYDPLTGKKNYESRQAFLESEWVEQWSQSFVYDNRARLESVVHADSAAIHYTYDAEDRVATVRDENHATPNTTYAYDPAGRVSQVTQTLATQPGGTITTQYSYHVDGNLASVTDPNGNVTTYLYSDFGELRAQISPVTGETDYDYDEAGNLSATVDANGFLTTRQYDELNRVTIATSEGWDLSETVTWSYDDPTAGRFGIGRLTSSTDPSGDVSYSYERRGLLREETKNVSTVEQTHTTSYTYNGDGNRSGITYPSGLLVEYSFDHSGRPTSATGAVTEATYLPFGPMNSLTFENGTRQSMSYDARYRMTNNDLYSSTVGQPQVLASYVYTYDDAGNVTGIQDDRDSTYDRGFQYDDLNRLTDTSTGSSLWQTGSYTWDAMGNLTTMSLGTAAGRSSTFAYDGTTPKLASVTTSGVTNAVEYDAAGNEISYLATRSYSARNLAEEIVPTVQRAGVRNTYDGRGIRIVSETTTGFVLATRTHLYTPELQLMAVTLPDEATIDYEIVWFAGRPVAQLSPSGTNRYTFTDHLGTPIAQTGDSPSIIWSAEYEPFGNIFKMRTGTSADQPLRFPGQEMTFSWEGQEENYNIHRWYKSGWGRYTQADPIGLQAGPNLYSYVSANPVKTVDPLGLAEWFCNIDLVSGGEVAGVGIVDVVCKSRPCTGGKQRRVHLNGVIGGITFGLPVGWSVTKGLIAEDDEPSHLAMNLVGRFEIHTVGVALFGGISYTEVKIGKAKGKSSGWSKTSGVSAGFDNFWGHIEAKSDREVCCK